MKISNYINWYLTDSNICSIILIRTYVRKKQHYQIGNPTLHTLRPLSLAWCMTPMVRAANLVTDIQRLKRGGQQMDIKTLKQSIIDLIMGTTNYEMLEIIHRFTKRLLD